MNSEQNPKSLPTQDPVLPAADTPSLQHDATPSQVTLNGPGASDAFRTLDVPSGRKLPAIDSPVVKVSERFGDYELLEPLGKGGMGVVYRARQVGLNRIVALKQIRAGEFAGDNEIERFYAEARAAGALDHPGIVPIYEVGQWGGQPFFSMGYVRGESLQDRLNRGPLVPPEATQLVKAIAEAVEYAHSQGIVHRDLKPGNILIDEDNQPRVTDFGLAKRTDGDTGLTMTGQVLGTPAYMPPEQAQAQHELVGPRSDVYALGAVLYAVLSGRPPFQAASRDEIMRQVVHDEPLALQKLNPSVPVDLETIALKCLEKEPTRRYASARDLADDLGRFLNREPVSARPITALSRAFRWCQRKPVATGLIGVATLLVLVLAIGGPIIAVREMEHSRQLKTALETANEQTTIAKNQTTIAQNQTAKANTATAAAERQVRIATAERLASEASAVRTQFPVRSTLLALEAIKATRSHNEPAEVAAEQALRSSLDSLGGYPIPGGSCAAFSRDGRWFATASYDGTARIWDLASTDPQSTVKPLLGHRHFLWSIAFSQDGKWLATGGGDGLVLLWDLAGNFSTPHKALQGHKSFVKCAAFSPSSRWLATGSSDQTARLWDLSADDPVTACKVLPHRHFVQCLEISPDERYLITGSGEDAPTGAHLWDLTAPEQKKPLKTLPHDAYVECMAISPDGRWLATGSADATARLWDLNDLEQTEPAKVFRGHLKGEVSVVNSVAFTPDGRSVITGAADRTACIWDLSTDDPTPQPKVLRGHEGRVESLRISPDGHWLVTGSEDKTARVWDLSAADVSTSARILRGHDQSLTSMDGNMAISPDSRWLITGSVDKTARIWDLAGPDPAIHVKVLRGHTNFITAMALSPDETLLATASDDKTARVWHLTDPDPINSVDDLLGHPSLVRSVAFAADRNRLATADFDQRVAVWDLKVGYPVRFRMGSGIYKMSISADGRWLAAATSGQVIVLDLHDERPEKTARVLPGHNTIVWGLVISSDGRWIATAGGDGVARLFDMRASNPAVQVKLLPGNTEKIRIPEAGDAELPDQIQCLALSPDERWLATGGLDGNVRLWDLQSPDPTQCAKILRAADLGVSCVRFGANSRTLFTAGKEVRIWDLSITEVTAPTRVIHGHDFGVSWLTLSKDNRWLATNGRDKVTCVWDLHSPRSTPVRSLRGHERDLQCLEISGDARWVYTAGLDNTARVWDMNLDAIQHLATLRAGRGLSEEERTQFGLASATIAPPSAPPPLAAWQRPRLLQQDPDWHDHQGAAAKPGSLAARFHALWLEKLEMDGVQVRGITP